MRKCHCPAVRSLRSHRPQHEPSGFRLRRCAAPPHHSPALPSTALPSKWRLRIGSLRPLHAHIMAVLHRPCALPGVIDHGCDSAACGRTGDTREHKRCACTPSRAHNPATRPLRRKPPQPTAEAVNDTSPPLYTAGVSTHSNMVSPCQHVEYRRGYSKVPHCAGAPAPPPPTPTVEAMNDTSTPPHTAGVSTHSTPRQYVENDNASPTCALIGGALQARTRQAIAQRTLMAPVRRCDNRRRTSSQRRQVGPRAAVAVGR
jgi:hypothetical protein